MNSEHENMPTLRFPEFKDGWREKRLGEVADVTTGNKDTQNRVENGSYPFFVRSQTIERINSYTFDGEAILTSGDGVGVGKNFHYIDGKFDYHQRVYCLTNFKNGVFGKYLFFYFAEKFNERVMRMSAKNSVDSVRRDMIVDMSIRFPSSNEQQKIAALFTAMDERIAQLTIKKRLFGQYKKGVMQQIFDQQIRFKDDNGNDFPDWEELKGKDVFRSVSNKSHNGNLPILAATQEGGMVYRDSIGIRIQSSDESVQSYKVVESGDFVISLRSFQGGLEYSQHTGICSPAYTILKPKREINDSFFRLYFKKEDFITRLSQTVVGIRDGKQISYEAFGGIKLRVPSLPEQGKIANFLNAIDSKIELINIQLEKTKTFKKGLLQQMFV